MNAAVLNAVSPVVTVVVSLVLAWWLKRIDGKAGRAEESASLAADRSAPTGNGFAARTESQLAWIVAEVGGLRADHRATNRRLDKLANRVSDHIESGQR